ncbi:hypothetical protein [uncultured Sphaerochaeta sp.]|uniref:hypothetical protein n=1 Tax=uncultured Sphaerochaeta sp. TaxID=886478 RepID=UPI002AA64876|nr:hypothetical protein [uncultured Sphaerochaeta sp.]
MKKFALFYLLLLVSLSVLSAGPFGIEMGQSVDTLKRNNLRLELLEGTSNFYIVVPKISHPVLEFVGVFIGEDGGVIQIVAQSSNFKDSGYGKSIRLAFTDIKNSIDSLLGPSVFIDWIESDSKLADPEDWLASIDYGDRYYFAIWADYTDASLPEDIGEITLLVDAYSRSEGFVRLEFVKSE